MFFVIFSDFDLPIICENIMGLSVNENHGKSAIAIEYTIVYIYTPIHYFHLEMYKIFSFLLI